MERRDFKSSATVAKLCCLVFFHRRSLSKEVGKKTHHLLSLPWVSNSGYKKSCRMRVKSFSVYLDSRHRNRPFLQTSSSLSAAAWEQLLIVENRDVPGRDFPFFFFLALKIWTQYDRNNSPELGWDALIILCRHDVLVLMLRRNERKPWSCEAVKPWSCEVSLRVRQPASRTCPPFGSCPGRRRRAGCSGGVPRPTGQTGAVHSGNSGRSLPWGNPATRDDQTHSLQHTQQRRFTMWKRGRQRNFLANSNSAPLCTVTGGSAQELGHHAKFKQSREKTIQSGCAAASRWPPQRLISSKQQSSNWNNNSEPTSPSPCNFQPRSQRNTNSTTRVDALCK